MGLWRKGTSSCSLVSQNVKIRPDKEKYFLEILGELRLKNTLPLKVFQIERVRVSKAHLGENYITPW